MTVNKKQLEEKVQTGGGATGVAHTADPVDKKALFLLPTLATVSQ